MYYFPLELFQTIIEFGIKAKLINKTHKDKIKNFFKEISSLSPLQVKEIEKSDYISRLFSKNEFMELYTTYLNSNDEVIKRLFKEVSFIDLEEIKEKLAVEYLAKINTKIRKIIEKIPLFVIEVNTAKYLVISFSLDSLLYMDIKNAVGEYKVVIGYPYDIFYICDQVVFKIRQQEIEKLEFLSKKDVIELFATKNIVKEEKEKEIQQFTPKQEEVKNIEIRVSSLDEKTFSDKKNNLSQILRKRKFFIIGSPAVNDYQTIKAFISEGIEAIKLHVNLFHPVSKQKMGSFQQEKEKILEIIMEYPTVLWGLVPGNIVTNQQDFEEINLLELESYFDFIDLFYHSYTFHYLSFRGEKMVAIDKVFSKSELEALEKYKFCAIEASVVDRKFYGLPLTLEDIINYKKIIENTDIPVLISTQKRVIPSDIPRLYSIGAKGIVLGQISTSFDIDTLKRTVSLFLEQIQKL